MDAREQEMQRCRSVRERRSENLFFFSTSTFSKKKKHLSYLSHSLSSPRQKHNGKLSLSHCVLCQNQLAKEKGEENRFDFT